MAKVDHWAASLKDICPWLEIETFPELFDKFNAHRLLSISKEYTSVLVLDCIDNIDTKFDLIQHCIKNDIPLLSSCGAGCKLDSTKLQIADISRTVDDPLARAVRLRLRTLGIRRGVQVLYSCERNHGIKLVDPSPTQAQTATEKPMEPEHNSFAPLPNFRSKIIPVLGPMPALFGMAGSMYAIRFSSGLLN